MTRAAERVVGDGVARDPVTRGPVPRGPVGARRRPRRDDAPDLLLDRYRLRRPIGEGATSTVWLAHDERLDRPVAVKLLRPGLLADTGARRRLRDEARAVARLDHPNVVRVHDVAVGHGRAAIVFEHVPGHSLLERLRGGPLAVPEALRIGAEVAAGLAAAHRLGIVHRDVKPANILLGDDGRARLADFGIATALGDAAMAEAGGIAGSLRYLAPERLRGAPPSAAADVWGAGVVAYRMLTGRMPFAGTSTREMHDAAWAGPPPMRGPRIPTEAAAVIRRALDPDPTHRPGAEDLASALAAGSKVAAVEGRGDAVPGPEVAVPAQGLVASAAARLPGPFGSGHMTGDDAPTAPALAPVAPATGRGATWRLPPATVIAAAAALLVATIVLATVLGGPSLPVVPGEAGALQRVGSPALTSPLPAGTALSSAPPAPTAAPRAAAPMRRSHGHGHGHGGGDG